MNEHMTPTVSERDDSFHFDQMSDRWWITETAWFSFANHERGIGGWLYSMFRPNIGTVAGGCWIWDASAALPWEVLYSSNYTALRIPDNQDLTDITLPTGVSIKMLEPLKRYKLGYQDEDRISLDLEYNAVMPPRPLAKPGSSFQKLSHFDQFGRVRGTIDLNGIVIEIDSLSMRDRSWGPRPEHRPGKSAYVTGMATPDNGFLAVTKWNDDDYEVAYGFHIHNGVTADIVSGRRIVERDPIEGWVNTIRIEAQDSLGRTLIAEGKRLSGIIINRHSFIDSNGLIEWTINGEVGQGEDQDMWPVHSWAAMKRALRKSRA